MMSNSARGGYILISAAGTSPEGLTTDEEDLIKQGEHTQIFFIYLIHINIYLIYLYQYNCGSGKSWGRGLA